MRYGQNLFRDDIALLVQLCAPFVLRTSGLNNNIKNIVGVADADV